MTIPIRWKVVFFIVAAAIPTTSLAQSLDNTLRSMAAQVSKSLPMMVSAEVQATSVAALGNRIMYKYNIKKPAKQIDTSRLRKEHYENSVNAMCSNPGTVNLLKQGAVVMYQFYDSGNTFLFEMSVTKQACVASRE
ncbi:MAG: hypothetical protein ABI955_04575 [Nitrospirota bacterium]